MADEGMEAVAARGDGFVAFRGGTALSADQVKAHLASLVRLENVGVFLGAGASLGAGGRTMAQVLAALTSEFPRSTHWLEAEGFELMDLERLLDALEVTELEWERVGRPLKLRQLRQARDDVRRALLKGAVLKSSWWSAGPDEAPLEGGLADHMDLLRRLVGTRSPGQSPPWVFTSNYDLAVEFAAEALGLQTINGFSGLHRRAFAPQNFQLGLRNMLASGQARFGAYGVFLAKLHGSLTWVRQDSTYLEQPASQVWSGLDAFLSGSSPTTTWDGLVMPSGAKYSQTIGFVLGELVRRFTEFLARPQSFLLVSGYSFSDEHLNRVIGSALLNPTLHLVVYLPELRAAAGRPDPSLCRQWVSRLVDARSPQVTLVGGGEAAHFGSVVASLPEPAVIDEHSLEIRRTQRRFAMPVQGEGPVPDNAPATDPDFA